MNDVRAAKFSAASDSDEEVERLWERRYEIDHEHTYNINMSPVQTGFLRITTSTNKGKEAAHHEYSRHNVMLNAADASDQTASNCSSREIRDILVNRAFLLLELVKAGKNHMSENEATVVLNKLDDLIRLACGM